MIARIPQLLETEVKLATICSNRFYKEEIIFPLGVLNLILIFLEILDNLIAYVVRLLYILTY